MERTLSRLMGRWLCVALLAAGCAPASESEEARGWRRSTAQGLEEDHTVNTLEIANHYAELAADAAPGGNQLVVTALSMLPGARPGDRLFVIQMQGAAIDTLSDAARYGEVTALGSAGRYEFVEVLEVDEAGGSLRVRGRGPGGGLRFGYSAAGRAQVIWVPRYRTLTVSSRGVLTTPAWNGRTGGVVVLTADTVQVDGELTASGRGFRGGQERAGGTTGSARFRMTEGLLAGARGEGIAGGPEVYEALGGRYGRGAAANAGGGGNAQNAAGGGGANGLAAGRAWSGQGVMDVSTADLQTAWRLDPAYDEANGRFAEAAGGGRGGYGCSEAALDPLATGPDSSGWGCGGRAATGGLGGRPLPGRVGERLFLGGGGGAGHAEEGDGGAGGGGGGLVFVLARTIRGEGRISAEGAPGGTAGLAGQSAGPGGGGGGGTVVLMATEDISAVKVSAAGGAGGIHTAPTGTLEGSGGGGGGGGGFVTLVGSSQAQASVAGGLAGTTTQPAFASMPTNGATGGSAGTVRQLAGFGPGFPLPVPAMDLQVTLGLGAVLRPGLTTARVHATVSNLGAESAQEVRVTLSLPENVSGRPLNEDVPCTSLGSTLECTLPGLEPAGSTVLEAELTLPPGLPRTPLGLGASVTGRGFDSSLANNQAALSMESYGSVHLAGGSCSSTGQQGEWSLLGLLVPLLWLGLRGPRARGVLGLISLGVLAGCEAIAPVPPVELRVSVEGQGEVASDTGDIACGPQCQVTREEGARLRLVATPASGQRFVAWAGRCAGTVPRCELTLLNAVEVTATFEPIPATCDDGLRNQDETDVDCGGGCAPCEDGQRCTAASDCQSVQCVLGECSSCALGKELIINGGAEDGPTTGNVTVPVPLPGWQTGGPITAVPYGTQGQPSPTDLGPAERGQNLFVGGISPVSSVTQELDLRACAPLIDRGLVTYELSAYLGGFFDQDDRAEVRVQLRDEQGADKATVSLGPVTPSDRGGRLGLLPRSTSGQLPPGIHRLSVSVVCTRFTPPMNNGYADNISLLLRLKP